TMDLVPRALTLHQRVAERAQEQAELTLLTPGSFRQFGNGRYVVYVGAGAEGDGTLSDVFVRSTNEASEAVTTARSGHQQVDVKQARRYLVLEDGFRYENRHQAGYFETLRFGRLTLQLDRLEQEDADLRQEARDFGELWQDTAPEARAELHGRLGGPLSLLLVTLIAPLLAKANPREGRYGRVFAGLLVYTIYLNLLGIGQAWIARGNLPPELGLWWVHGLLLAGIAALWLYHYPPLSLTPQVRKA
ncbi:MAG: LptF/LptG family permease, partial [Candidatus Competibacterales bacterium]|nr:LptF/LptG family permease [Candidatus Competibacterales bacterium]